jgi:PBP1b-binding outer membrane lipoprotein LpoB
MRYLIVAALLLAGCSSATQPAPSKPAGVPTAAPAAPQPPNPGGSR